MPRCDIWTSVHLPDGHEGAGGRPGQGGGGMNRSPGHALAQHIEGETVAQDRGAGGGLDGGRGQTSTCVWYHTSSMGCKQLPSELYNYAKALPWG